MAVSMHQRLMLELRHRQRVLMLHEKFAEQHSLTAQSNGIRVVRKEGDHFAEKQRGATRLQHNDRVAGAYVVTERVHDIAVEISRQAAKTKVVKGAPAAQGLFRNTDLVTR